MKNIIVVGDSFCCHPHGWPQMLADKLNLTLINYGVGGQHWWGVKTFLDQISLDDINNTTAIVFAHTFGQRIPTDDKILGTYDLLSLDRTKEPQLAIELYYKYIQNKQFIDWAQSCWFNEVSRTWSHNKLINLHCFPWTVGKKHLLSGVNVFPNLSAISLNEIGANEFKFIADQRINHFSHENNVELANQLAHIINNYAPGDIDLDITKFQLKTKKWFSWE